MDEANVESHGLWEKGYYVGERDEWKKMIVERNSNMVKRDKNHPSIIFWSMGNESGWGVNFDHAYKAIKEADPEKRPVHYESKNPAYAHTLNRYDIISDMYSSMKHLEDYYNWDSERPIIICGMLIQWETVLVTSENTGTYIMNLKDFRVVSPGTG